jgi:hypothetical protein
MTIQDFLNTIKFPEKGKIDKKIFKKAIYENAGLARKQIEIIKNEISEIRWHYVLKPETINIPIFNNDDFEYEEIQMIGVNIKDDKKKDSVAGIIQKCIPYPIILVLEHEDKIALSVASKRINKADASKNVIDEEYITNWILNRKKDKISNFLKSLQLENLSYSNLFEFYKDLLDRVKLFCACEHQGEYIYENKRKTDKVYSLYQQIKKLGEEKNTLQKQIKKEGDFAKKVKLNVEIKKLSFNIEKRIKDSNP